MQTRTRSLSRDCGSNLCTWHWPASPPIGNPCFTAGLAVWLVSTGACRFVSVSAPASFSCGPAASSPPSICVWVFARDCGPFLCLRLLRYRPQWRPSLRPLLRSRAQWRTTRGRDCRSPPRARTQQWSPERPPLRARPQQSQAQERPAVAGEQPDACARWRARRDAYDQYDRRRDEREATRTSGDPHYIQANSETWIAGWTGGWSVPGAEWTAVAAEATNVGAESWWRRKPEAPDNETPAGALREVVRTLDDYECSQDFRYKRVTTAL